MEQVKGLEPLLIAWQAIVLTFILYLHIPVRLPPYWLFCIDIKEKIAATISLYSVNNHFF